MTLIFYKTQNNQSKTFQTSSPNHYRMTPNHYRMSAKMTLNLQNSLYKLSMLVLTLVSVLPTPLHKYHLPCLPRSNLPPPSKLLLHMPKHPLLSCSTLCSSSNLPPLSKLLLHIPKHPLLPCSTLCSSLPHRLGHLQFQQVQENVRQQTPPKTPPKTPPQNVVKLWIAMSRNVGMLLTHSDDELNLPSTSRCTTRCTLF